MSIKKHIMSGDNESFVMMPGDNIICYNDALKSTVATMPTSVKKFTMHGAGSVRVKFDLVGNASASVYAVVYKNGVSQGAPTSVVNSATTVTGNVDITFAEGDAVELDAWTSNATYMAMVKNFRLCVAGLINAPAVITV